MCVFVCTVCLIERQTTWKHVLCTIHNRARDTLIGREKNVRAVYLLCQTFAALEFQYI